jgi:guanylate kinase
MSKRGLLFIVSAPSGTGKTTIVERLAQKAPDLVMSRSYTSRPIRPGEVDGVDYNFVSESRFTAMAVAGKFLEWAAIFGHRYGTNAVDIEKLQREGRDVVLVIDVQGARQVRERNPDAIGIFVLPPSFAVLEERLRLRSGSHASEQEVRRRLETARREVEACQDYEYVVVNDDVDDCVDQLSSIVVAKHLNTATAMTSGSIMEIIGTFRAE